MCVLKHADGFTTRTLILGSKVCTKKLPYKRCKLLWSILCESRTGLKCLHVKSYEHLTQTSRVKA